jgi:hypothetical protein
MKAGPGRVTGFTTTGRWLRMATAAVIAVALSLVASGCLVDLIHEHLVGRYYLIAAENEEQLGVGYHPDGTGIYIQRIPATVIDVGWDDRYIVAARRTQGEPGSPLRYYYIDIAKDGPGGAPERAVTGPLTEEQFKAAKAALSLPEFTLHYPKLR